MLSRDSNHPVCIVGMAGWQRRLHEEHTHNECWHFTQYIHICQNNWKYFSIALAVFVIECLQNVDQCNRVKIQEIASIVCIEHWKMERLSVATTFQKSIDSLKNNECRFVCYSQNSDGASWVFLLWNDVLKNSVYMCVYCMMTTRIGI